MGILLAVDVWSGVGDGAAGGAQGQRVSGAGDPGREDHDGALCALDAGSGFTGEGSGRVREPAACDLERRSTVGFAGGEIPSTLRTGGRVTQLVWANGSLHRCELLGMRRAAGGSEKTGKKDSHWSPDREYAALHTGFRNAAVAVRSDRGAVHRRYGPGAGILAKSGADGGEVYS